MPLLVKFRATLFQVAASDPVRAAPCWSRPCPSRPAASFNALLSASPSPRHDVLMACSVMTGDWGWRKERYPLNEPATREGRKAVTTVCQWVTGAKRTGETSGTFGLWSQRRSREIALRFSLPSYDHGP